MAQQPKRTSSETHLDFWDKRDLFIISVFVTLVAIGIGIIIYGILYGIDFGEKKLEEETDIDASEVIDNTINKLEENDKKKSFWDIF